MNSRIVCKEIKLRKEVTNCQFIQNQALNCNYTADFYANTYMYIQFYTILI